MTIGIELTKSQLDNDMGNGALTLARFLRIADQLHEQLLITSDATLEAAAIGYTAAEVATIKSAWNNDAVLLVQIIRGEATLQAAQDFRANLFQLIGTGVT